MLIKAEAFFKGERFNTDKMAERVAQAVKNNTLDAKALRWFGPETLARAFNNLITPVPADKQKNQKIMQHADITNLAASILTHARSAEIKTAVKQEKTFIDNLKTKKSVFEDFQNKTPIFMTQEELSSKTKQELDEIFKEKPNAVIYTPGFREKINELHAEDWNKNTKHISEEILRNNKLLKAATEKLIDALHQGKTTRIFTPDELIKFLEQWQYAKKGWFDTNLIWVIADDGDLSGCIDIDGLDRPYVGNPYYSRKHSGTFATTENDEKLEKILKILTLIHNSHKEKLQEEFESQLKNLEESQNRSRKEAEDSLKTAWQISTIQSKLPQDDKDLLGPILDRAIQLYVSKNNGKGTITQKEALAVFNNCHPDRLRSIFRNLCKHTHPDKNEQKTKELQAFLNNLYEKARTAE